MRPFKLSRRTLAAIGAALVALFAAVGLIQVTDENTGQPVVPSTPTPAATAVQLGGPGDATVPATAVPHDPAALEQDLAGTPPAAVAAIAHNDDLKPAGQPTVPAQIPLAAPSTPGCKTALVRNYSSRNGAPILLFVVHWTGSAVTPGWAGIDGNLRWFDTPAAEASSTYITANNSGDCALAVPETEKAWTQAGFNSWSISDEIVNPGTQPLFLTQSAFDRVVDLIVGVHERWKLPLQRAKVSGCKVLVPGVIDHKALGDCGGGHPDVGTYDIGKLIDAAKARVAAGQTSISYAVLTKGERAAATCLTGERAIARRHGGWSHVSSSHLQRATTCKTALSNANLRLHAAAAKTGWDRLNRRARHTLIHELI